jgi:DNA-binding transcriptional ArsR family regulator
MMTHTIFAALADPARFKIVELLKRGERSVSDVVSEMDVHQSGVSRHLGVLLEAGLVEVRRDGPHRRYSLRADPFRDLEAWALGYRRMWDSRLDRLEAALDPANHPKNTQGETE